MQCFDSISAFIHYRQKRDSYDKVGFVPTMGNLHRGHLSLVQQSQEETAKTAVSIFVNPLQFNDPEDLAAYPRTREADLSLLEKTGVDYCLLPQEEELYQDKCHYRVFAPEHANILEGKYRPGHFTGVLTVVLKLLHIVQPTIAYFGEKDYQQYQLIKEMAEAFFLPTIIRACPTVREESKLALSSRNQKLTQEEHLRAQQFASIFHQKKPLKLLQEELQKAGFCLEYLEEYQQRRFIAVRIGKTRLIDNYAL